MMAKGMLTRGFRYTSVHTFSSEFLLWLSMRLGHKVSDTALPHLGMKIQALKFHLLALPPGVWVPQGFLSSLSSCRMDSWNTGCEYPRDQSSAVWLPAHDNKYAGDQKTPAYQIIEEYRASQQYQWVSSHWRMYAATWQWVFSDLC
jgi:hypothetical protein